jgi:hypothetical protein
VDISIELTEDDSGRIEATCPELGLVARASSFEKALERISRLVVYVTSSLESMPLTVGPQPDGLERFSASFSGKNFWMPRYPKVH